MYFVFRSPLESATIFKADLIKISLFKLVLLVINIFELTLNIYEIKFSNGIQTHFIKETSFKLLKRYIQTSSIISIKE